MWGTDFETELTLLDIKVNRTVDGTVLGVRAPFYVVTETSCHIHFILIVGLKTEYGSTGSIIIESIR